MAYYASYERNRQLPVTGWALLSLPAIVEMLDATLRWHLSWKLFPRVLSPTGRGAVVCPFAGEHVSVNVRRSNLQIARLSLLTSAGIYAILQQPKQMSENRG